MRWPLVSRRAYDNVVAERDRLVAQVESLQGHLVRIDRIEHGVSEIPRDKRPPLDPMPPDLHTYINGFAFPQFRRMMRNQAYQRRAQGESWVSILADLRDNADEPESREDS